MSTPQFQHEAMATFWELTLPGAEPAYARQAAQAAFRELDRLEGELSRFIEHSVISRANRLPRGGTLTLPPDTLGCLLLAAEVSVATGRAFDPAFRSSRPPDLPPELPPYFLDPETHRLTSRAERLAKATLSTASPTSSASGASRQPTSMPAAAASSPSGTRRRPGTGGPPGWSTARATGSR
jgi:hypothetical protein